MYVTCLFEWFGKLTIPEVLVRNCRYTFLYKTLCLSVTEIQILAFKCQKEDSMNMYVCLLKLFGKLTIPKVLVNNCRHIFTQNIVFIGHGNSKIGPGKVREVSGNFFLCNCLILCCRLKHVWVGQYEPRCLQFPSVVIGYRFQWVRPPVLDHTGSL